MPFVFVASASDLRRDRTRSVELPDLAGNGAYSQRQSHSNHARRRRTVEPLSAVRRRSGGGGDRGRIAVVDQPGRLHVDRLGRDSVFLLKQTVVPELLDPQTCQWTDRLFSYRGGRQRRQTQQELGSASTTGIHRAPARIRQASLRKPSRAPLARVERIALQQAQSGLSGRRHLFEATRLRGDPGRRRTLSVRLQTRQPQDDERISEWRRSSLAIPKSQAWQKILQLHLALDAGPADPRRQGCARGQLAGNHHPRFQPQDHLSQQLHHRFAGLRRQRRAPRRRRKGEVENRERDLQHLENQGVQSRAQFRPRKKQPVGGPRHSQSDRLRNSPGRPTRRRDLESRHRSRRLQSPFLQQPARPDRLPPVSLMGQPPQNPRLSGRPAASFMTFLQNENCWIEALKILAFRRPRSDLEDHRATLESYFREHPPASVKEAMATIEKLTGVKRSPERVRAFLKRMGMKCRKVGMIPAKADIDAQEDFKKNSSSHVWTRPRPGNAWSFSSMPRTSS